MVTYTKYKIGPLVILLVVTYLLNNRSIKCYTTDTIPQ